MKILITGANGMVGRNLTEQAQIAKHQLLTPSRKELDLSNRAGVSAWMGKNSPDMVIHCAGRVGGIQANMRAPTDFLLENLEMGNNVVMAAAEAKVPRLINMGSSCMYPRGHQDPLKEEMILTGELEPTNEGYALAKIVTQRLCSYVKKQFGFDYKTLVPCNLYGRFDKFDPAHSHMVPAVIHKLFEAKKNGVGQVEIWGSGEARREFLYAGDLADFVAVAIEKFDQLPELLNVGLGYDYSVNEYYKAAAEVVGYQGEFTHDLSKPVGMARKLVSVEKLEKFGWRAPTDLKTGLQKTLEFYLSK